MHEALIANLRSRLTAWRFVKNRRSFERSVSTTTWYLHLTFVNHLHDFDVVTDDAVEHVRERKRVCIVGAELGNLRGTGQHRWGVSSPGDVPRVASDIVDLLESTGQPFLERFSSLTEVLRVLRNSPNEARLIMPFASDPNVEAASIEARSRGDD
jgi:hypothetical protein